MKGKKIFFFLIFLLISQIAQAVDYSDFSPYQGKLSREEVEKKLMSLLIREPELKKYFSLNDDALVVYSDGKGQIEFILHLAPVGSCLAKSVWKKESLQDVKIAIDPGHFGGKWAKLEERYIEIAQTETGQTADFNEGTLSFLTAAALTQKLEQAGAKVMITRESAEGGVCAEDFFDWLRLQPQLWTSKVPLSKLFRHYYNPIDLRARATKINEWKPDLTVVIHYNAHQDRTDRSSNHQTTEANFNLVFVPGAFCSGELSDMESRYEFIRLLVSDDLNESTRFAKILLDEFTDKLKVEPLRDEDGVRSLGRFCMRVDQGIYARNLALTRLIHGPIGYGESLVQNHVKECENLQKKDVEIFGQLCSSRVQEVADAYFIAIERYFLGCECTKDLTKNAPTLKCEEKGL